MASVAEALALYRGSDESLIHNDMHAGEGWAAPLS
jgi:hypothetical protein